MKSRITAGDTPTEALRALKRRISGAVYRALIADTTSQATVTASLTA